MRKHKVVIVSCPDVHRERRATSVFRVVSLVCQLQRRNVTERKREREKEGKREAAKRVKRGLRRKCKRMECSPIGSVMVPHLSVQQGQ